ncbi:MAG: hypothetical protein V1874_14400 [Spirochaetota bacterium]
MAKVRLSTLVADVRNRLGNVVFSKWKDTNYVWEYTSYSRGNSEKQAEVRNCFALLVSVWKSMGQVMHSSWNEYSKNMNMTGFNAFIKTNSALVLECEAMELFKSYGENEIVSIIAEGNASAGEIICSFSVPQSSTGRYVVFFVQKIMEGKVTDEIRTHEAGINPVSPFTISGLEPGGEYFVYAVITDGEYSSAVTASASVSVHAVAGA